MLAWVPQGCTATELDVYSQQSATITVTLRAGTPGAMADTALELFAGDEWELHGDGGGGDSGGKLY